MMWHFEDAASPMLADASRFLDAVNSRADFFVPEAPVLVARAPGRLDLMGGIADYSGSLVLQLPLAVAAWAAVQFSDEPVVTLFSTEMDEQAHTALVRWPLSLFQQQDSSDYHLIRAALGSDARTAWAAYVAGTLAVLRQECGIVVERGVRIFVHSEVPMGKGVSSSAALEVATMQALCSLYRMPLPGRELALLCQRVENLVVGAPCGVMDQMTAACGVQDSLLTLLCQPAELQEPTALPPDIEVWGIDSGIRHAVTGADYGSVRVGAFMGYRIIAHLAGLTVQAAEQDRVNIDDNLWRGYLANIPPSLWEACYREQVPEQLLGRDFLQCYGGSTDTVTRIDPGRTYAVRQPAAHPIYEHHRVRLFRTLLGQQSVTEEQLQLAGELMYQSHASYSGCGLGSRGTDRLVELVRQAGPGAGLYGAKITGGGSGGTVAVLARRGARPQIEHIARQYEQEMGLPVVVLSGSSPGAIAWGCQTLLPA